MIFIKFEEVMKFLLSGFKVRRLSWDSEVYIKFNKFGKLIRYSVDEVGAYPVDIDDVRNNDWNFYNEEE